MTASLLPAPARPLAASALRLGHTLAHLWRRLRAGLRASGERHQLLALDDHLLADIGLDRASVRAEARRPFWDLPEGY